MTSIEDLQNLADEFVELCEVEGVDAIALVEKAVLKNGKSNDSADEISKKDYYRLAMKVVKKIKSSRKMPNDKYLRVGAKILYIIHQKQYDTLEELCNILAVTLEVEPKYAKYKVFACYYNTLPIGLSAFLYALKPEELSEWFRYRIDKRYEIIEEVEAILYEKIKAEYESEKGG